MKEDRKILKKKKTETKTVFRLQTQIYARAQRKQNNDKQKECERG